MVWNFKILCVYMLDLRDLMCLWFGSKRVCVFWIRDSFMDGSLVLGCFEMGSKAMCVKLFVK